MSLLTRKEQNKDIVPADENLFEDLWSRFMRAPAYVESRLPELFSRRSAPPMNVGEDENGYHVALELPGMAEKDIDIQIMGRQLVISGERRWKEEKKEKEYHRIESQFGRFERAVTLPEGCRLEVESIKAVYDKGMLEITIPKVEPTPARKVPVRKA